MKRRGNITMSKIAFLFPGQGSQEVGMGGRLLKMKRIAAEYSNAPTIS